MQSRFKIIIPDRLKVCEAFTDFTDFMDFMNFMALLLSDKSQDIIPVCKDQECKKDYHPGYLCVFQEFIAWFPSGYHFIKQEHHMTPVKSGDRQDIHHCKDY